MMISVLHWKKRFFNQVTTIHSADGEIGRLDENSWKQTAHGEINNRKFTFKTRGLFNPYTEILDPATDDPVGKIEYNTWRNKAHISYLDQSFQWQYDNTWQTRWSITDSQGKKISFQGSPQKGSIEGPDLTEFLVITGLFVTKYYLQTSIAIFVAIFIPIIASQTR